jgi:hypothetical protein
MRCICLAYDVRHTTLARPVRTCPALHRTEYSCLYKGSAAHVRVGLLASWRARVSTAPVSPSHVWCMYVRECRPRSNAWMADLQSHRCAYPPYDPDAATLVVCAVALASTMWTAHVDAKGTKKKDSGNRGKCDTCKQIVKVGGAHVHMHRTHAHTPR